LEAGNYSALRAGCDHLKTSQFAKAKKIATDAKRAISPQFLKTSLPPQCRNHEARPVALLTEAS
jgi:hypothetical protein